MRKALKIVGIIVLVLIVGIFILLKFLGSRPAVPANYTQDIETGGSIEAKYMAAGGHEVSTYRNLYCKVFQNIRFIIRPNSKQAMKNILSSLSAMEAALLYPNFLLSRNILPRGDLL